MLTRIFALEVKTNYICQMQIINTVRIGVINFVLNNSIGFTVAIKYME